MMDFKWNGILLVLLAVLITVPSAVTSLDIAYCSPQNTGSDFDAGMWAVVSGPSLLEHVVGLTIAFL